MAQKGFIFIDSDLLVTSIKIDLISVDYVKQQQQTLWVWLHVTLLPW